MVHPKELPSGSQGLNVNLMALNCLTASSCTRSRVCPSSLFDLKNDTACGFLQERAGFFLLSHLHRKLWDIDRIPTPYGLTLTSLKISEELLAFIK